MSWTWFKNSGTKARRFYIPQANITSNVAERQDKNEMPYGSCAKADNSYFRISLTDLSIADKGNQLVNKHPILYSVMRFQYGGREIEINRVFDLRNDMMNRTKGSVKGVAANKIVIDSLPLIDMMPYIGGPIQIGVALLAIEEKNPLLPMVLGLLTELSEKIVLPKLESLLPITEVIGKHVESLLNTVNQNQAIFKLGYLGYLEEKKFLKGYQAFIADRPNDLLEDHYLGAYEEKLHYTYIDEHDKPTSSAINDRDFFLLRFDLQKKYTYWTLLPDLQELYHKAFQVGMSPDADPKEIRRTCSDVINAITASPNLVKHDKKRCRDNILEEQKKWIQAVEQRQAGLQSTNALPAISSLAELMEQIEEDEMEEDDLT